MTMLPSFAIIVSSLAALLTALDIIADIGLDTAPDIDWDLLQHLVPLPAPSIPVVYRTAPNQSPTTTQSVVYSSASAASIVATAVQAGIKSETNSPITINPVGNQTSLSKRQDTTPATCVPQPTGNGPVPQPDTPSAFLAHPAFASFASNAPTPSGYIKTFSNLNASNNAYGYMGYTLLPSYSPPLCATTCTSTPGCASFNLYFSRDPSVDPNGASCANPPSTTNIKCVLWGGPVSAATAVNTGQYRGAFHVVIAGSAGYVNHSIATPPGYSEPAFLGPAAINAPPPCAGRPSRLLQSNVVVAPSFDVGLCAAACGEQAAWAAGREGMRGCGFFDTYVLYRNGTALGQWCAMYDEVWNGEWASNTGYWDGADRYTIGFSYSSKNITGGKQGDICRGARRGLVRRTSVKLPKTTNVVVQSSITVDPANYRTSRVV